MPFDELTPKQKDFLLNLIEKLSSGNFEPSFWAHASMGPGWQVHLTGVGGHDAKALGGFSEPDLHRLKEAGYLTLLEKKHPFSESINHYTGSLTAKALDEYRVLKTPSGQENATFADSSAPRAAFDKKREEIEKSTSQLLRQLNSNYEENRRKSKTAFWVTVVVSVVGAALLVLGAILALLGWLQPATVSTIGGILSQFITGVFFVIKRSAEHRQDKDHESLVRRQQVLSAVQFVEYVSDPQERDRLMAQVIESLVVPDAATSSDAASKKNRPLKIKNLDS